MSYFVKIPAWLRKLYGDYTWDLPAQEKVVYLTFDDGPNEAVTSFVLDSLKDYSAKASFFLHREKCGAAPCIGATHFGGWQQRRQSYVEPQRWLALEQ